MVSRGVLTIAYVVKARLAPVFLRQSPLTGCDGLAAEIGGRSFRGTGRWTIGWRAYSRSPAAIHSRVARNNPDRAVCLGFNKSTYSPVTWSVISQRHIGASRGSAMPRYAFLGRTSPADPRHSGKSGDSRLSAHTRRLNPDDRDGRGLS